MSRPPKDIFDAVIRNMDGPKAYTTLKDMGYKITQYECRIARQVLAKTDPRVAASLIAMRAVDPAQDAAKASAKLEEAICGLYAKTAARLGCKLETAALVLNYTPTQIAKMARAA